MRFMKLKLHTAAALLAIVALASCAGNDNKDFVDKTVMPTSEEKAATPQSVASTSTIQNTGTLPANLQQSGSTVVTPAVNTLTVPAAGPVVVNPVAGQAKLTSQNNAVITPVQTPVQPTAAGMNPPHGQPGHRCDISVGAPLNSKPAPAPAATNPTPVNAQPQVTMKEVAPPAKTAPGMNPPHGEPNHRCDIAVGAPLNSKPAAVTATPAAPPALLTAPKADSTKN